jgi:hypothetical protein
MEKWLTSLSCFYSSFSDCRCCGKLVCAYCSCKKFATRAAAGLRACDSCYNSIATTHFKLAQGERRSLKAAQRLERKRREAASEAAVAGKFKLIGEGDVVDDSPVESDDYQSPTPAAIMASNQLKLAQRGETLNRLQDRTSRLQLHAEEFARAARTLKESQK